MVFRKGFLNSRLAPWFWPEAAPKPSPVASEVSRLFEEYRAPLLRYILSFGLPLHDAEDTLQEVFLSLFDHLRRGKPRHNLRGWIFRVGHNLALKRRAGLKPMDALPDLTLADPAPDPEQLAASRHLQSRLLSIFEALPERDRCCLLLRAEGLRYREIAATLNISLGSVSASLTRSLTRLNTAYEGESQ